MKHNHFLEVIFGHFHCQFSIRQHLVHLTEFIFHYTGEQQNMQCGIGEQNVADCKANRTEEHAVTMEQVQSKVAE